MLLALSLSLSVSVTQDNQRERERTRDLESADSTAAGGISESDCAVYVKVLIPTSDSYHLPQPALWCFVVVSFLEVWLLIVAMVPMQQE